MLAAVGHVVVSVQVVRKREGGKERERGGKEGRLGGMYIGPRKKVATTYVRERRFDVE